MLSASVKETSPRVRIIGDVCSLAARVVIWLGPEDKNVKPACKVLHRLTDFQKMVNPNFDSHDTYWPFPDGQDSSSEGEARAVSLFFAKSCFPCIWVVQQVAAVRKAVAYCGIHVLPWKDIMHVLFHIFRHTWKMLLVWKGLPEVL